MVLMLLATAGPVVNFGEYTFIGCATIPGGEDESGQLIDVSTAPAPYLAGEIDTQRVTGWHRVNGPWAKG